MIKKKNGDCDLSSGFHVKDPFAELNIGIFILGAPPRFGCFLTLIKWLKMTNGADIRWIPATPMEHTNMPYPSIT